MINLHNMKQFSVKILRTNEPIENKTVDDDTIFIIKNYFQQNFIALIFIL